MNIIVDSKKYDEYQEEILKCIIRSIRSTLENKEIDKDVIEDLTGSLAFGISAIIDSSAVMGTEDNPILPYLAFSKNIEEKDTLIVNKGGSYLHEMVFSCIDDVFEEEYDEEDSYPPLDSITK
ncbi:MAG: hypothetical protein KU38_09945 [Sulfurovum sp. FS08-3]|nr:MAG: hypothetical protein KU38_09945 [Sulfurovum sp. FS08-3]